MAGISCKDGKLSFQFTPPGWDEELTQILDVDHDWESSDMVVETVRWMSNLILEQTKRL